MIADASCNAFFYHLPSYFDDSEIDILSAIAIIPRDSLFNVVGDKYYAYSETCIDAS